MNKLKKSIVSISLDCDDDDTTPIPTSVYPYNRPVTRQSTANAAKNAKSGSNVISLDSDDDSVLCGDDQHQLDHPNRGNNSFEAENYEMRIKVKWGMGIETFAHRKFQKFADIVDQLAAKESADS
uniref:Uncharacterized protein n=1 Tax=Anopheles maculatus TaxID=74869 RepID=A0A182S970_9DIPT